MDKIISNPGLWHLAENVFWNLDVESLKKCGQINQSCREILQNPVFCLNKFKNLSKENQNDWIKVINSVKNAEKGIAIISYLQWKLKKEPLMDIITQVDMCIICGFKPTTRNKYRDFRDHLLSSHFQDEFKHQPPSQRFMCPGHSCKVEVKNLQALMIHYTRKHGDLSDYLLEFLVSQMEYKEKLIQIKGRYMDLPCYTSLAVQDDFRNKILAFCKKSVSCVEDIEIVEILAPLTGNLNAPVKAGNLTPIEEAAYRGHTEVVKILAPLVDNPNHPTKHGITPLHRAASHGHTEIVKILAPLTDNPNGPNDDGKTPIQVAGNEEIRRILQSFINSRNCIARPSSKPSKKRKFY